MSMVTWLVQSFIVVGANRGVPQPSWCMRGKKNLGLCCDASCAVCGGPFCKGKCCGKAIKTRGFCKDIYDTQCILPQDTGVPWCSLGKISHEGGMCCSLSCSDCGGIYCAGECCGSSIFKRGYCRDGYETSCLVPDAAELKRRRLFGAHPRIAPARDSLFCFTLVATRAEVNLLKIQRAHGLGVFGCDEYQVFSNVSAARLFGGAMDIHVTPVLANTSLQSEWEFNALNTGIFVNVWKRVFRERRYHRHLWVVKLDVDLVFFPHQLRQTLRRHCRGGCGEILFRQNYTHLKPWVRKNMVPMLVDGGVYGSGAMFGPLMVMSREAVSKFAAYFQMCKSEAVRVTDPDAFPHSTQNTTIPEAQWDRWSLHEDVFVDRCMDRVGVDGIIEWRLMRDWTLLGGKAHRIPYACPPGFVGYHPYKMPDRYLRCQSQAGLRAYRAKGGKHVCSLFGSKRRDCIGRPKGREKGGKDCGFPRMCPLGSAHPRMRKRRPVKQQPDTAEESKRRLMD